MLKENYDILMRIKVLLCFNAGKSLLVCKCYLFLCMFYHNYAYINQTVIFHILRKDLNIFEFLVYYSTSHHASFHLNN
jgi:hypothetical protein